MVTTASGYTSAMDPSAQAGLLHRAASLLTRLPWPVLRGLAHLLARLWAAVDARESRVARRNIALVFGHLDAAGQARLHRQVMEATARQIVETLWFWTHPPARNLERHIAGCHGAAIYARARAGGRGLILLAPHHGNWELLNQWLAAQGPLGIVYAPPESPVGDAFLQRVRGVENITQIRAEGAGVRQMLRILKEGGTVAILPDQQPKQGDGVFAPFFGMQALTMTLVNRLAAHTGAGLLYAWCERRDDTADLRFDLHIEPAPDGLADPDPVAAATRLNADIEAIVRRAPHQYQWTYKRFTLRPPGSGEANPYADLRRPRRR